MRLNRLSARSPYLSSRTVGKLFSRRISKKIICLALLLSLIILPTSDLAHQASFLVSFAIKLTTDSSRVVSHALTSLFHASAATRPRDTTADRTASVTSVRITPARIVGYTGQRLSFSATGTNAQGKTIQGAQFSWSSSNADKLQIDGSGMATLNGPGMVWVTAATPNVSSRVPVLIRPGERPFQSDVEWLADQGQLRPDGTIIPISGTPGSLLDSLARHLTPTALAQTNGGDSADFLYDELWSEPRNLVGFPRNRVVTSSAVGAVLPEGSNFEFSVPLYGLSGRGLPLGIALNYNSRIWSRHGSAVTFNAVNSWPYLGFTLSFGRIVTYLAGLNTKFVLVDSDGTRRYLGSGPGSSTTTYQTNDGSHITYVGSATSGGTLYYNSGVQMTVSVVNNRLLVTRVLDPNGNFIQVAYKSQSSPSCGTGAGFAWNQAIDTITDTLGRVIQFNYDSCNNLVSVDVPGYGGTAQSPVNTTIARFDYQTAAPSTSFSGLTVENVPSGHPVVQLKHVYFPATNTGYKFTYSAYGMINTVSLRKEMDYNYVTGAIGDGTEKAYVSFNYPAAGSSLPDAPSFSQWTQSPAATSGGTATYSFTASSGTGTKVFTVTNPDSTTVTLTRSDAGGTTAYGLLMQTEVKTGAGASMAKSVISYATDGGGSPQVASIVSFDDATPTASQTKVDFDYDSYGNVTNRREYGFQQGGSWVVRRRTRNLYKTDTGYVNAYLRALVIENAVYDARLDTNDANDVLVAKTTYTYDDYAAMGGMYDYGGTGYSVGHLSSYGTGYTVRGNVTGTTQFTDVSAPSSITHLRQIDIFGNVFREELSCCNQQVMNTDSSNGYAILVSVVRGASGTTLTTVYSHDFNTSLQESITDPNSQQSSVTSRDAALRVIGISSPTGATTTASYNDSALTLTQSVTYDDGGTQMTVTETTEYDGWGRVIKQVDGNGGQINTSYDAMGRVASVTNPFTPGGTPSYSTGYSYDALGRQTTVTLPDTQTVQTSYNGNSMTVTDQVNRKIQRLTDGLGRVVTVNEQDSTGSLSQATNYAFDLLNNLTEVNQGNQLRKYKYDALSRLLYEKIPEQTATINDGTGTYWSCKYTHTDFNALATRTDARGVVTSYSYDLLNRLYQVGYNTVSGVTTAPTMTYYNDVYSGTTAYGKLVAVSIGADYVERYTFDDHYRLASTIRTIGSKTYTTSYDSYNEANQLRQMTYPSGRELHVGHDGAGRLFSLYEPTGGRAGGPLYYLDNVSYNIAGQVTGDTLGNDITEQFGYDARRMQLTTQKAGTTSPYTNRLDLTYSYSASAGWSGAGSVAGNAGQLMSVSGSINSATESASYTYDNVSRIVTSNQASNSSSAQRRFAYDRWGNRTGVWGATSGGTQIQSITYQNTIQGGGSAPTNRIGSVTSGGTTLNYTYDANGNVTNDGAHSYTYDSENRLVSVDGGSATYAYDHQNQRYKKTVSGVITHYVWEGGKVLAEHSGSTGAALVEYVSSGSQMIAKVVGSTTNYFLSDKLSVRLILDDTGGVVSAQGHLPFGEDFAESGSQQKHHFTSYERDAESGTDYAVNRQYNQSAGRFLSADPYRSSGQVIDPQGWNRYSYTQNEPINRLDPMGLCFCINYYREDDGHGNELRWVDCFLCEGVGYRSSPGQPEPQKPESQPCLNSDGTSTLDGFVAPLGNYSIDELNAALVTIFGELSARFNANSRAEAEAIASIIFNRSTAIANGTALAQWGASPALSDVVSARRQFAGFRHGQRRLQAIKSARGGELNQGQRNCDRLQTAGGALVWLGMNPDARQPFYYMCAVGHVGRSLDTSRDVVINGNVFSPDPLNCN